MFSPGLRVFGPDSLRPLRLSAWGCAAAAGIVSFLFPTDIPVALRLYRRYYLGKLGLAGN